MKFRRRYLLPAGALLLGLAIAVVILSDYRQSFWEVPPAPAPRRAIVAIGKIEPRTPVIEVAAYPSTRLGSLLVREGATVAQGDVLAYLDDYAEQLAASKLARCQLQSARDQRAAQLRLDESEIARIQVVLKDLERSGPLDRQILQLKVAKAEEALAHCTRDVERRRPLVPGTVSVEDMRYCLFTQEERRKDLELARESLAKFALQHAAEAEQAQHRLTGARAQKDLAEVSAALETLERKVDLAEERLQRTIIRAPSAGQILHINAWPGESLGNRPLLAMGDLSAIHVVGEIYETDVMLIREGQRARVTAAPLPAALEGTVQHVSCMISRQSIFSLDPTAPTDTRVARVRIRLDQPAPADRLVGLQVTVHIPLDGASPPPALTEQKPASVRSPP
jgi:HlyD family secretion protein